LVFPNQPKRPPPTALSYAAVTAFYNNGRQTIYFGGQDSRAVSNELWTLTDCYNWLRVQPTGTIPTARAGHTLVLNANTTNLPIQRLYMYGGDDDIYGYNSGLAEFWTLDRTSADSSFKWTQVTIDGPTPGRRNHHSAIWDSERGQMILFGGRRQSDVWAFIPGALP
jgi:hypothetical protein